MAWGWGSGRDSGSAGSVGGAGGNIPILAGETLTILGPNVQVLWTVPIEMMDATSNIDVTGTLVEVR